MPSFSINGKRHRLHLLTINHLHCGDGDLNLQIQNLMKKLFLAASVVALCSGCASVLNDVTHPMKVETKTEAGAVVTGADCKLTNDYGVFNVKSGDTAQVRRSSKDLAIECTSPTNPVAKGQAVSRANGGMFGNIILGGGIGAVIDHNKGTAYTYPLWVQLVFGKTLSFDRKEDKEAQPNVGAAPAAAPVAAK